MISESFTFSMYECDKVYEAFAFVQVLLENLMKTEINGDALPCKYINNAFATRSESNCNK